MVLLEAKDRQPTSEVITSPSELTSESGTSTIDEPVSQLPGKENPPPPPYFPSPIPSEEPSEQTPSSLLPSNYVHIHRIGQSIKGKWLIDTSLVVPTSLLPPLEEGQLESERPHLNLYASREPIHADVELVGTDTQRAILKLASDWDPVILKLTNPRNQKVHITAIAKKDPCKLYIPRTFCGPITCKTSHGKTIFSKDVKNNISQMSESKRVIKSFLGRIPNNMADDTYWEGDEMHVESNWDDIKIYYLDEHPDFKKKERGDKKSLLSRMFSG